MLLNTGVVLCGVSVVLDSKRAMLRVEAWCSGAHAHPLGTEDLAPRPLGVCSARAGGSAERNGPDLVRDERATTERGGAARLAQRVPGCRLKWTTLARPMLGRARGSNGGRSPAAREQRGRCSFARSEGGPSTGVLLVAPWAAGALRSCSGSARSEDRSTAEQCLSGTPTHELSKAEQPRSIVEQAVGRVEHGVEQGRASGVAQGAGEQPGGVLGRAAVARIDMELADGMGTRFTDRRLRWATISSSSPRPSPGRCHSAAPDREHLGTIGRSHPTAQQRCRGGARHQRPHQRYIAVRV